jgi:hypothetical protein
MTRMWNAIASSLVVAAVCAGGGGLLIANSTHADVETLKEQAPAVESRMQAVEKGLASVKAATDERAEHDKEFRDEQRAVNENLNRKLDALLARTR